MKRPGLTEAPIPGLRGPPKSVKRSRTFTVSGSPAPGSGAVRLYQYRYEKRKWRLKSTVWTNATTSRYAARIKLKPTGSWKIRAYHPADSASTAAWSGYRSVKVK